jgi:[ribosomal protein S5]-alanine N-acetyltransferase
MQIDLVDLHDIEIADVVSVLNHPRLRQHMPLADKPFDADSARAWVESKKRQCEPGHGPWGILVNGGFAGWGGLLDEAGVPDLALVLLPAYWGAGGRIGRLMTQRAFERSGVQYVTAHLPLSRRRLAGILRWGFLPAGQAEIDGFAFNQFQLFNPLQLDECLGDALLHTAAVFRQQHFFDPLAVSDPYAWTLGHPAHRHFLLWDDDTPVGYAHVQRWPVQHAVLRIVVIHAELRGQGLGSQLLAALERQLRRDGVSVLQLMSTRQAMRFYLTHGYAAMPLTELEEESADTDDLALGKVLCVA